MKPLVLPGLCLAFGAGLLAAAGAPNVPEPPPSIWRSGPRAPPKPNPKASALPRISVKGNRFVDPAAWRRQTPRAYLALLDQAVDWCTDLGMHVIIDWHSIGNLRSGLFQEPIYNTTKQETFDFW